MIPLTEKRSFLSSAALAARSRPDGLELSNQVARGFCPSFPQDSAHLLLDRMGRDAAHGGDVRVPHAPEDSLRHSLLDLGELGPLAQQVQGPSNRNVSGKAMPQATFDEQANVPQVERLVDHGCFQCVGAVRNVGTAEATLHQRDTGPPAIASSLQEIQPGAVR
jgi:hypothetical protein